MGGLSGVLFDLSEVEVNDDADRSRRNEYAVSGLGSLARFAK